MKKTEGVDKSTPPLVSQSKGALGIRAFIACAGLTRGKEGRVASRCHGFLL